MEIHNITSGVKGLVNDNQAVTIKGTKEGLVFLMDDQCEFSVLIAELNEKMNQAFKKFVNDAVVSVVLKMGKRKLTEPQRKSLYDVFATQSNLVLNDIQIEPEVAPELVQKLLQMNLQTHYGTVRSGQVLEHDGNLLFLGDINPGGTVAVTGSLYVMGALRGLAHAGAAGDESCVIVASHMHPTQLRIAGTISRPPDEWVKDQAYMEFAYLEDGQMKIDKVANLHKRIQRSE